MGASSSSRSTAVFASISPTRAVEDGVELIQLTCTGNPDQRFILRHVGAYRSIMNVNSQKCLSVEGASTAAYAAIVQEPCNTALAEQLFLAR
ncbi:RICIN domain-containing protein [Sorangium sp. So ce1014]|uniref:RICIN domain-containing protein n=1 Tax=Sorangium sp. So ce1014 TaxID=3133326 RepID=UPI003F5D786E